MVPSKVAEQVTVVTVVILGALMLVVDERVVAPLEIPAEEWRKLVVA
jgi:hypothetical protein